MNPLILGFLRGLGFAVLTAVLIYVGDATHITFLSPQIAALLSMVALAAEHQLEAKTGKALFGAVTTRK